MKLIRHLMVAAVFLALLAGNSIAQEKEGNKSKQMAAAAGAIGAASTAVNGNASENNKASEPSERERLLLERIDKLEQRLVELELRSSVKPG